MAFRGADSTKVKPIINSNENDHVSTAVLLQETKQEMRKPVLYPARTFISVKPSDDKKLVDHAKFLMDKYSYSGYHQSISSDSGSNKYTDKFRVMLGVRNVYDELESTSTHMYPAELRRFFNRKRHGACSSLAKGVSLSSFSSSLENAKRQRLDLLVNQLSSTARKQGNDFQVLVVENNKKKKDEDKKDVKDDEEEEEEEGGAEEEDDFNYSSDDDDGDDYTAQYQDDDEEGNDAFGDDDEEAF